MKLTGMTRPVDSLGRIVLPSEIRRSMDITTGDLLEIMVEDDHIALRKYEPTCIFCGSTRDTVHFSGKLICRECLKKIIEM